MQSETIGCDIFINFQKACNKIQLGLQWFLHMFDICIPVLSLWKLINKYLGTLIFEALFCM